MISKPPVLEEITRFRGQWNFLSNFYPCEIKFDGEIYPSVEHAYQAAKAFSIEDRERIRQCATAGKAKSLGRKITIRKNWDIIRVGVMRGLLIKKFSDVKLRTLLLSTKDADIIEGNDWHDTFWGVCLGYCSAMAHSPKGSNNLGKLLMDVRKHYLQKTQ